VEKTKSAPARSAASRPAPQTKAAPTESALRLRYERFRRMVQNTWAEIKKVTWPDSETTRNLTVLVIAMSTVLGLLLGGIDYILLQLFEAF
jgi:preprotein translocase SecE subunit